MFSHLLVAIDDSPTAQRALTEAADLARGLGAPLTVMTVVPRLPAIAYESGADVSELERQMEQESQGLLDRAMGSLGDGVRATPVLRRGHAAEEVLDQLRGGGHDLLVMGSRGRGRIASGVLGSVSATIHFHAHVPVLIVPPAAEG